MILQVPVDKDSIQCYDQVPVDIDSIQSYEAANFSNLHNLHYEPEWFFFTHLDVPLEVSTKVTN